MITIRYSKNNSTVQHWKEKLEELVVAHELIEEMTIEHPMLKDKEVEITGEEAIQKYLVELEDDIHDWRKPSCGV